MKYSRLAFIALIFFLITGCNPWKQHEEEKPSKFWYKGNLHTHSYWSDGDEFPEVIMDWYKSNDYQFLALSEHNIIADGDKWVVISKDSIYQNAFTSYLENYGSDWVQYKNDTGWIQVKLKTLEEYGPRFEEREKFLIVKSEEITDRFENKPLHMNATNIQKLIQPQGGNSVSDVLQNNINEVIKQREETGTPMFPHINHPNFGYGISLEDMIALRGERFFEVYNGHPAVHNSGDSFHMSTEEMWDRINLSYIENGKPIMYGLATDDSHHYHVKDSKWSNAGRGWIMVLAESLNTASLIDAMENGSFYATTGVNLKTINFSNNTLAVEVTEEPGVSYSITFTGIKKGRYDPENFKTIQGGKGSFLVTNDILFVRCKVTSSKLHSNPVENILYEMAWTQPVVSNQ